MKRLLVILFFIPLITWAWQPTRPVTVVIGNAPGAGNELAFRKLASIINRTNKKLVFVVENRAGADSVIAMNHLAQALPDGHTIAADGGVIVRFKGKGGTKGSGKKGGSSWRAGSGGSGGGGSNAAGQE